VVRLNKNEMHNILMWREISLKEANEKTEGLEV